MKLRYAIGWGAIYLSLIFASIAQAGTVRIGIVYDGESSQFQKTREIILNEIQGVTQGVHHIDFPAGSQVNGGWNVQEINKAIDRMMDAGDVDMVLALGEVSAHEACRRRNFSKPVFAVPVVDAKLQEIPSQKGTSGVRNLNYINTFSDIDRELRLFQSITPFSHIAIIVDDFIFNAIPQLEPLTRRLAQEFSMEVAVATAKDSGKDVLAQIPPETDAVFLLPVPRLSDRELHFMSDDFIARKLPSFSLRGRPGVSDGILAGTQAEENLLHLARNIAVNIQEVLNGADAGNLPTIFEPDRKLVINMATARAIDIHPNWSLFTEAELIHDEPISTERRLNITTALQEALTANLDLAAASRSVEAGRAQVKEARSSLLPQIELGTETSLVDDDRAAAYAGTLPERQWTGSVQATQVIYSEKAWAGFTIERHMQAAREKGLEAVRLDIIQAAAGAYLNVLRARSIERIHKENLKLTRKNLERARIRVEIGAGGPEEIYRWESEIADSRRNLLKAQSVTLNAFNAINTVLNRPISDRFAPDEADETDPLGILPVGPLTGYMENDMELDKLGRFLVTEGLNASPELKEMEAALSAQARSITQAEREFWVPTVSVFSDVTESFSKSGEGSKYASGRNDTDWSVGIKAGFPLYSGGKKSASLERVRKESARLHHKRDDLKNGIEERVLNAVHLLRASYPGIRLSRDAADAAGRNLALVTDSYARGIKPVIDLIDAQNQALVANRQATNAVYDFLIDIMALQRRTGSFFLLAPRDELDGWMKRCNESFSKGEQP
nr:TolC family protein [Desulfobacula sp.]